MLTVMTTITEKAPLITQKDPVVSDLPTSSVLNESAYYRVITVAVLFLFLTPHGRSVLYALCSEVQLVIGMLWQWCSCHIHIHVHAHAAYMQWCSGTTRV